MQSEPGSGIKLTAYSCICWLFHRTHPYSCFEGNTMDKRKHLLQWHAENGHEKIFFMDQKMFTIEEQYNNQYNKIHAQKSLEVRCEGAGGHHPSYVMVWWGVSHQGVTPLHICEKGVKTRARVYQEDVLQGVVNNLNITVFNGQKWVFQQK